MKTLVTGGSGYIGSAVVRELLESGEKKIKVLVRDKANSNLKDLDVERVTGDITDFHSIKDALRGCDRVFHLAAIYALWLPDPKKMYWVNVQGTRNVLEACLQKKIKKVVYTSSVAALGAHGKEHPADESAEFNLWHTKDHYYISKFQAEQVALDYHKRGLPVVIVNPTNPCGSHDAAPTPNGQLIINIIKGKLPGYVDGGINVSDIGDTAKGHTLAMEKGKPGEKYILGGANVSVKEYFDLIAQVGRGKSPSIKIPKMVAELSGYLYQGLAKITRKPPITTAAWVRVGSEYSSWDSSKAIDELGMPQTPIRESVKNAIDWFRDNGYL